MEGISDLAMVTGCVVAHSTHCSVLSPLVVVVRLLPQHGGRVGHSSLIQQRQQKQHRQQQQHWGRLKIHLQYQQEHQLITIRINILELATSHQVFNRVNDVGFPYQNSFIYHLLKRQEMKNSSVFKVECG